MWLREGASGNYRDVCVWVKDGKLCKAFLDDHCPVFMSEDDLEEYLKSNYRSFEGKSVHDADFLWITTNFYENVSYLYGVEY